MVRRMVIMLRQLLFHPHSPQRNPQIHRTKQLIKMYQKILTNRGHSLLEFVANREKNRRRKNNKKLGAGLTVGYKEREKKKQLRPYLRDETEGTVATVTNNICYFVHMQSITFFSLFSSARWRLWIQEANGLTSSAKSKTKDATLWCPNQKPSFPWLYLGTPSMACGLGTSGLHLLSLQMWFCWLFQAKTFSTQWSSSQLSVKRPGWEYLLVICLK